MVVQCGPYLSHGHMSSRCPRHAHTLPSPPCSHTRFLTLEPPRRLGKRSRSHAFFSTVDWDALGRRAVPPPVVPKLRGPTDASNFSPQTRGDEEWLEWDEFNDKSADSFEGFDPIR